MYIYLNEYHDKIGKQQEREREREISFDIGAERESFIVVYS